MRRSIGALRSSSDSKRSEHGSAPKHRPSITEILSGENR
jgi:hypothetical protein